MKTILVLFSILMTSSASAYLDRPSAATLKTSCRISNEVSNAIFNYFDEQHLWNPDRQKIKSSLIVARENYGNKIEEVLNHPENATLRWALRDFQDRILLAANSGYSEFEQRLEIKKAADENQALFFLLRKALNQKVIAPSIFADNGDEVKEMKVREFTERSESYAPLFQQGMLHLPLSFDHYNKKSKSGALQYWFELGIEFQMDGTVKVVDKGETTAIAMAGFCDQDSQRYDSNQYFVSYTKINKGQCEQSEANSVVLYEDDVKRQDLAVRYNKEETSFSPYQVAQACDNEGIREAEMEAYFSQHLARRPNERKYDDYEVGVIKKNHNAIQMN